METAEALAKTDKSATEKLVPSTTAEIDRALKVLCDHKDAWVSLGVMDRIAILDKIRISLKENEQRLIDASLVAKGTQRDPMGKAEEFAGVAAMFRQIRLLRSSLNDIARYGKPKIPGRLTTRANGQVVAQVIPIDWKEKLELPGTRAEVWMDSSVRIQNDGVPQASFYQDKNRKGEICAILGAGNFSCLVTSDFLTKLFIEGKVIALKMNPVNAYLGPIFANAFAALISNGYLQILYGAVDEGIYLYNHPYVDCVHMTGSDRTFEAIVFGPGEQGRRRKLTREPLFTKPFSAELGNISPVIVVPGPWTKKDIQLQSKKLASWLAVNAGFNCLTPRVFIQMKNWQHRTELNKQISRFLSGIRTRKAYYPGSTALFRQFIQEHPDALQLGNVEDGDLPWTFVPGVDALNREDICFNREPFMSLFSETALEADSVPEFIGKAVDFANDHLWGTLAASIVVHPKSLKDPEVAAAVDKAIADLHYGSVVINSWGFVAWYLGNTLWGGYPGSDIYDIQSGVGFVNNALMFDRIQKSVCYTDFNPLVDPVQANNLNSDLYFQQEATYQFNPSIGNLLKTVWRAMSIKEA